MLTAISKVEIINRDEKKKMNFNGPYLEKFYRSSSGVESYKKIEAHYIF